MSVRTRRQMVFSFFIVALVVAVIAGAAGYATGYGVESAKRIKLMEENKLLTEKNAELSAIEIDMEEKNALAAENEELKAEIEAIKAEKTALEEKVTELEGTLSDTQETLSETESALSDAEAEAAEGENGSQSKFMDKLTKWFIIGIVGVLVIMGVMMLLVPKNSKKYDSDEDEEDEDEDKGEETGVEASTPPANEETKEEAPLKLKDEEDVQTEIVFPEENKQEENKEYSVPDSLEELMRESIKRKEQ